MSTRLDSVKMPVLRVPLTWLTRAALGAVALVVVRELELVRQRSVYRRYRATQNNAERAASWWTETKRMIDRGYVAFCQRRGLDPAPESWVERRRAWFAHLPPVNLGETLKGGPR